MVDRRAHGPAPVTPEILAELRREASEHFDVENQSIVEWALAWDVMGLVFGVSWMQRNLREASRDPYLRYTPDRGLASFVQQSRVLELSTHLYSLQECENFSAMVSDLRTRSLTSAGAELTVAHLLHLNGRAVAFVERSGIRGHDFDFVVTYQGCRIAVEVKTKDDTTTCTARTVRNSLNDARSQLPPTGPGLVVLAAPLSWTIDPQAWLILLGETERLLRGTRRVNGVLLTWDEWAPALPTGYALMRKYRMFLNHAPRAFVPLLDSLVRPVAIS